MFHYYTHILWLPVSITKCRAYWKNNNETLIGKKDFSMISMSYHFGQVGHYAVAQAGPTGHTVIFYSV